MSSSTYTAPVTTEFAFTPSLIQIFKPSTTSPITMTRKHTLMPLPPTPADCHQLTAFSDACWGGQFGNAVPDGTPLELFKYCSLSGYLICCAGGPIAWKAIRQNQTASSLCVAEINATHQCITFSPFNIMPSTSACPTPQKPSPFTTTTSPPSTGHHPALSRAQSTSTSASAASENNIKTRR
jgi:hypothetical protein